jgi:hypothetical protein
MATKAGDWLFDNTLILPEYNENFPLLKAPFLDTFLPDGPQAGPLLITVGGVTQPLRPGLCGGYFYKITGITDVRDASGTGAGPFYQVLTLDRPARSDGFVGTMITGIADVIEKGVGRMPAR